MGKDNAWHMVMFLLIMAVAVLFCLHIAQVADAYKPTVAVQEAGDE